MSRDPVDPKFGRTNHTMSFVVDAAILLHKQGETGSAEKLLGEHHVAPTVVQRVLSDAGRRRPVKFKPRRA